MIYDVVYIGMENSCGRSLELFVHVADADLLGLRVWHCLYIRWMFGKSFSKWLFYYMCLIVLFFYVDRQSILVEGTFFSLWQRNRENGLQDIKGISLDVCGV